MTLIINRIIIAYMSFWYWWREFFIIIVLFSLLGGDSLPPGNRIEQVRAYTRNIEFDYILWTIEAFNVKLDQNALNTDSYLPNESDHMIVGEYLDLVARIQQIKAELYTIYADPTIKNPNAASESLQAELNQLSSRQMLIGPLSEAIIQTQLGRVATEMHLSLGGQALPPILFHSTHLPLALIVSPRVTIRQDANISLVPDLSIHKQSDLEEQVDQALDVSSLVEQVGGVGVYPTMVMQTSDLNWMVEVVAHEWAHNYLTLRPLGISYLKSPELRTMNETAASIAGKELGRALIEQYYPELIPPPPVEILPTPQNQFEVLKPPAFDFRAEMRITRVKVDALLNEGMITEAEKYMEARRVFFWDNGYHLRKLNQAYFAFHGAYADQPGGAAGEDPVGAAVRALRARSPSLSGFLNRISWMWSYEQLQQVVRSTP